MSPSENMEVDARDTERMAAAGAWKAWTDSSRARATTAADCMIDLRTKWRGGEAGRAGGRRVAAQLVRCAHAVCCARCRRGPGG